MFEIESAVQNPPKLPQMTDPPKAAEPQETAEKISVPGQGWIGWIGKGREQREDAKAHGIKKFKYFKKFVKKGGKAIFFNLSSY